jgi:hypothetical protein
MTIIQIAPLENGQHPIQSQSGRSGCWLPGYIEVPEHLENAVKATAGWCDLDIQDGVLAGVTPTERPTPEPIPVVPTEMELAQQDITDLQLNDIEQGQQMTDLELTILGGVTNV